MKKLICREFHPWIYAMQNALKKVAIFFVGVLGAAFVFTMSVEEYREKLFDTIKTYFETDRGLCMLAGVYDDDTH